MSTYGIKMIIWHFDGGIKHIYVVATHMTGNSVKGCWLSSCELLNMHIKPFRDAIFQWSQDVIVMLLQCFYYCSFHIRNSLEKKQNISLHELNKIF